MGVSVMESFVSNPVELESLFFRSFLLSQGDPDAQQHLFFAIAIARPEWQLGPDMIEQMKQRLLPQFVRYLSSGWHDPLFQVDGQENEERLGDEVENQLLILAEALNGGCPMPRERLLELVMGDVINNDYSHLVRNSGRARPEREAPISSESIHARYFSHFCHFVLQHRSTGAVLYDQLFAELASAYVQQSPLFWEVMKTDATAVRLELVLQCHNRAYPDRQLETPGFSVRRERRNQSRLVLL